MTIRETQLSAMGIHYLYHTLHDMLESQKRAGYRSVELWGGAPHVLLSPTGCANLRQIRREILASGLHLGCVTPENCSYPWQFAAADPELIADSRGYFLNGLRLTAELECPLMAVNSGWGLAAQPWEEAMLRSLDMIAWLADQAEPMGVTLVMESLRPEESNLVTTLFDLKTYLQTLGRSNLKPMVDTCAMAVAGETLEDWFSAFGGDISHLHFVDGLPYGHLAWGDGNRSLSADVAVLEKYHYQGLLTQEITDSRYFADPYGADVKSIAAMQPYLKK